MVTIRLDLRAPVSETKYDGGIDAIDKLQKEHQSKCMEIVIEDRWRVIETKHQVLH